eukprot:COSAG04_NODE_3499_length_2768_cov_4.320719_4_plen_340_part_00
MRPAASRYALFLLLSAVATLPGAAHPPTQPLPISLSVGGLLGLRCCAELAAEAPKRKLSSRPGAADSKGFGDAVGKVKEAAGKGAEILDKISSKLKRRGGDRTPRAPRAPRAPPPPRRRSDTAAASGGQPERLSAKEQAVVEGLDAMLQERFQGDWCAAWPSHRCSTHIHPGTPTLPHPRPSSTPEASFAPVDWADTSAPLLAGRELAFRHYDGDSNGQLDHAEVKQTVKDAGVANFITAGPYATRLVCFPPSLPPSTSATCFAGLSLTCCCCAVGTVGWLRRWRRHAARGPSRDEGRRGGQGRGSQRRLGGRDLAEHGECCTSLPEGGRGVQDGWGSG